MDKIFKHISVIILFVSLVGAVGSVKAQIPEDLLLSLSSGNAKNLSEFFNQNIELVIGDDDNVYSKTQAKQIVSNFFKENQPDSFNKIHDGGKDGSKYVIGNLHTVNGNFRVYFLLKEHSGKFYIHQLRIEKQS